MNIIKINNLLFLSLGLTGFSYIINTCGHLIKTKPHLSNEVINFINDWGWGYYFLLIFGFLLIIGFLKFCLWFILSKIFHIKNLNIYSSLFIRFLFIFIKFSLTDTFDSNFLFITDAQIEQIVNNSADKLDNGTIQEARVAVTAFQNMVDTYPETRGVYNLYSHQRILMEREQIFYKVFKAAYDQAIANKTTPPHYATFPG